MSAKPQALLWSTADLNLQSGDNSGRLLTRFKSPSGDIPTTCSWVPNNHSHLLLAYRNSGLALFDTQGLLISNHQLAVPSQPNHLDCHPTMSLAATAHESGDLTLFDFAASKTVKILSGAHSAQRGAASQVRFANGGLHLISGGHDGSVKIWDMRTHRVLQEVRTAHQSKFDEAVMSIALHPEAPFFASGGADCVVNIYELRLQ